jgi:hypothetical protein
MVVLPKLPNGIAPFFELGEKGIRLDKAYEISLEFQTLGLELK